MNAILTGLGGQLAPVKPNHATGGHFFTKGPTSFMAGEAGTEEVRITPAAKVATRGSDGPKGLTIVIQGDVHDYKSFERKVRRANNQNLRDYI